MQGTIRAVPRLRGVGQPLRRHRPVTTGTYAVATIVEPGQGFFDGGYIVQRGVDAGAELACPPDPWRDCRLIVLGDSGARV
jgi:hypothetical protein